MRKLLLVSVLFCGVTPGVFAADHGRIMPPPEQDCHEMKRPAMPFVPPAYAAEMTTGSPNDVLKKIASEAPGFETGKKYQVRVMVSEIPPLPEPPQMREKKPSPAE